MINVGIIRYPGSNCDLETQRYFNFNNENKCFFIWHKETDFSLLDNLDLLVLPGGFAFGDRIYNKATENYIISPGTMALSSPVSVLINEAVNRNIAILGICNGFQILTQMNLLPGKLILNDCEQFVCKKVKCNVSYKTIQDSTELYIANSYGKYVNNENKLREIYSSGDIYLAPAIEDAWPKSFGEAMLCGTPVLSFKNTSIGEVITNNINGFTVKNFDSNEYKLAIDKITNNIEQLKIVSENGRKLILNNFTPDKIAKKYVELYKEILN